MSNLEFDVVIIGGGPAGSTVGGLLRKYAPTMRVGILEKERFPRDHVGESQLPTIGYFLAELGCWDKVEAAEFPIKIGATYVWGKSDKPWDFEFIPLRQIPADAPRPGRFEGYRQRTAFQVDRSKYDKILLDHARELGCEVFEETLVRSVEHDGDRVTCLRLADGREVRAKHFVDATGHVGVLRRAMGVQRKVPTSLMNIAVWDYWNDAEWATTIGQGGTRVQVLSLPNGWCWFIPISPTRTSIGFICPLEYYKQSGKTPAELYEWAVSTQPRVRALTANATREHRLATTNDWSFVAERIYGENWFVVGEAAGFADPILAGGLTLAHESARNCAYVILELDRGRHDRGWLLHHFDVLNRRRIEQFIRFADYWYAANGQFTDLQEFSAQIAKDAGMTLTPAQAFRWLSLGGFHLFDGSRPGVGGLDLGAIKEVTSIFSDVGKARWEINRFNVFKLDVRDAEVVRVPLLHDGEITAGECYQRGDKLLPRFGVFGFVIEVLRQFSVGLEVGRAIEQTALRTRTFSVHDAIAVLEVMLLDGWVEGKLNKKKPAFHYDPAKDGSESNFHANTDRIAGVEPGH